MAKPQSDAPDRVLSTRTVTGQVIGFEQGDYTYANLRDGHGKISSLGVTGPEVLYFLATHRKGRVTVTVQKVDTYLPEAAARQTVERIASARWGRLTAARWWQLQLKHASRAALIDRYDALLHPASTSPILVAIDDTVLAAKTDQGWGPPAASLAGAKVRLQTWDEGATRHPVTAELENDADAPIPCVTLKTASPLTPGLRVAAPHARHIRRRSVPVDASSVVSIAQAFAASKGFGKAPLAIDEAYAVGNGSDLLIAVRCKVGPGGPKPTDFDAVLYRPAGRVGAKLTVLAYHDAYGPMQGPFKNRIDGLGDFAGDGRTEIVLTSRDARSRSTRLLRLNPAGETETLASFDIDD